MSIENRKRRRRLLLSLVFILSLVELGLLIAAYSTQHWVDATPTRKVDKPIADAAKNLSSSKLSGYVHLGLFVGVQSLDNGLGPRVVQIDVRAQVMADPPLFSFGLWVAMLVFGLLTAAWALVSAGFALLNIGRKPVRTLSGPAGLYLWNTCGLIACLAAIGVFLAAYFISLSKNVLRQSDIDDYFWTSDGAAWLGMSFYLLVGCVPCVLVAHLFTWLAGGDLPCRRRDALEKTRLEGMDAAN
uniref:Transmembrane protein n=1 Tax=Macrostomum lignano TaxID=282301 RepID=A0A1I8GQ10_9PLAT